MKYLHQHVSPKSFDEDFDPYNSLIYSALGPDCVSCIAFLRELGHPWAELYTECAADNNFTDLFRYLIEHGCPCDAEQCALKFSEAGSLQGLMLLFERYLTWTTEACGAAAAGGHFECLTFLVENGPVNYDVICESAAPHLNCLTYVHQKGGKLTTAAAIKAASAGALECLQYLHSHGCAFDVQVTNACAQHNLSTDCLQFVLDSGCPMNEESCQAAASRLPFGSLAGSADQKLACLKLLRERGCPWDENTCYEAASCMNITCLQYAVEHGCPWGERTRSIAKVHCAKYLDSVTSLKRKISTEAATEN